MTATERQFQDELKDMLYETGEFEGINTFECEDLMTRDAGLVVTLPDGREFQITIVAK